MSKYIDLILHQGSSFKINVYIFESDEALMDISPAAVTLKAQMRKTVISTNYTEFDVEKIDITYDEVAEKIFKLSLDADVTKDISTGKYFYDILLTKADGDVIRIIEGVITVSPQITRDDIPESEEE